MRWTVDNGEKIMFWRDNWIDSTSLVDLLGLDNSLIVSPQLRVCDFITTVHNWNIS